MITVIAKNQTAGNLAISTLSVPERIIPASGQITLTDYNNVFEIIASEELETLVNSDDILLNVNGSDLNKTKSLNFLNLDLGSALTTSLTNSISLDGIIGPIDYNTNQHNLNPTGLTNGNYLWLNPTSPNKSVTGIMAPAAGVNQVLFVLNTSSNRKTTLKHNDANSDAANRFLFKVDIDLEENEGAVLVYCHVNQRWKCVATNK